MESGWELSGFSVEVDEGLRGNKISIETGHPIPRGEAHIALKVTGQHLGELWILQNSIHPMLMRQKPSPAAHATSYTGRGVSHSPESKGGNEDADAHQLLRSKQESPIAFQDG